MNENKLIEQVECDLDGFAQPEWDEERVFTLDGEEITKEG